MTPVPPRLTPAEVAAALASLPAWRREGDALAREYVFGDFGEAFAFMARVALLAERLDHHPDWRNVWSRVEVRLTTHDAGGITERDVVLAREMDRVSVGHRPPSSARSP
ncbi:4a-hydroxytetrahydrobiopterin dehydratase [Myxococcota bacterium]|nr:4a-hydroxytetrahydrobiopterin dehydratase [Myxococcota bacterium]